jgi:hypothetical protein
MIADGNIVAFENGLGNELNQYDATKIMNSGENFGLFRNEKILAVEARDAINLNDTIFYQMQNLRQQAYQLRFAPVNISTGLTAFLIDRYNNSSMPISLTDSSFIDIAISGAAGSNAPDRFILVFRQPVVVPVLIVNIAACRNSDQSNQVTWQVENEINLQKYVVERSGNGTGFSGIGNTSALANNGGSAGYTYRDAMPLDGVNFYRIKAISNNGQIKYSNIVKVISVNRAAGISVYPNPVNDKTIHITFTNQKKGKYILELTNKLGQLICKNIFYIDQINVLQTMRPVGIMASGTYQLSITKADGSNLIVHVVVR